MNGRNPLCQRQQCGIYSLNWGVEFIRRLPSAALSNMVKYYWYFEMEEDETPYSQIGFPYGSFELIYYSRNPNKMRWFESTHEFYEPDLFYAGQLTKPYVLHFEKACRCSGISLQPWMGDALFGIPANQFRDILMPLADLGCDAGLLEKLAACKTAGELFDCFELFLNTKLSPGSIDPLVMQLAKSLSLFPNYERLELELGKISLGRRRIEQRFLESAGLSLGLFIKKMRFQQSLRSMANLGKKNLNALSAELEYYDQSHFVHDFKKFSGMTPGEYLNNSSCLSEFFQQLTEPAVS